MFIVIKKGWFIMKVKQYIVMLDEQRRYRLIKYNSTLKRYDEVIDMSKFESKEIARTEYKRLYNLTDEEI